MYKYMIKVIYYACHEQLCVYNGFIEETTIVMCAHSYCNCLSLCSFYYSRNVTDGLTPQVFESDIIEIEKVMIISTCKSYFTYWNLQQNYALNVARLRSLTKQGYLLKGVFWNDGASIASIKVHKYLN